MDRPKLLERIFNEIYNHVRENDGIHANHTLLEVILEAMERYERKKLLQISGSATLFFIVKAQNNVFADKVRRKIIRVLLNGMIAHRDDQFMLSNGCLCLCQFKIPHDVVSTHLCVLFLIAASKIQVQRFPNFFLSGILKLVKKCVNEI